MSSSAFITEMADRLLIRVEIKTLYGVERIYPVNKQGQIFASMLGQKTLSRDNIDCIKALGFTIEVVVSEVKL